MLCLFSAEPVEVGNCYITALHCGCALHHVWCLTLVRQDVWWCLTWVQHDVWWCLTRVRQDVWHRSGRMCDVWHGSGRMSDDVWHWSSRMSDDFWHGSGTMSDDVWHRSGRMSDDVLCNTTACFYVIYISLISDEDYPCAHYFLWRLPCVHYFYVPWLIMTSQWVMKLLARDAHCNITMGNDVARDRTSIVISQWVMTVLCVHHNA